MKKVLIGLVALIVILVAGAAIALMTFDADKYRPQLVELLGKQTGRTVKLSGPIKLGLSLHGASLTIQDAAISNPSWASRQEMAGIGKFELGIALLPLLSHQLSITELQIANADIQLETNADGKHNWDIAVAQQGKADAKVTTTSTGKSVAIQVDHVAITDSQLSVRDKDGKVSIFKTKVLTYGVEGGGIAIHFDGDYNSTPITLDVKTDTKDLMASNAWSFDLDLAYADYDVKAKGKANLNTKVASISDYSVTAGKSDIHGQLTANWAGARPSVKGTIVSNALNPADFKPASAQDESGTGSGNSSSEPKRVFSDAPLPFDSLKSVDAAMEVNIASLTVGGATLTEVTSKIDLNNGQFSAPLKAGLGKSIVGGNIKIDANTKPPQIAAAFSGPSIDLADLLAITHAPAFLSGTANADMTITTSGYSMHNLAGYANGKMNIIAAGGSVSSNAASGISSGLMELFAPKGGTNTLNCLAARFNITNGLVKDNGILVDSVATTVEGNGGFNLGLETINLVLHAKPKMVSIGGVLPPLEVGGTFTNPRFNLDPTAIAQNVAGILTSGSLSGLTSSSVPDVSGPAGQNACVYTLDHPKAATSTSSGVLVPGVTGQVQKLKDAAPALLKGLLGQ